MIAIQENMLQSLLKLLPAPRTVATPALSWDNLDGLVGLKFPSDVCSFIELYGAGSIGNTLDLYDPRRGNLVTLTNHLGSMEVHRAVGNRGDVVGGLQFFPTKDGFFPIGGNGNGDSVWVEGTGRRVAVFDGDETERFVFDGPWTAFLVKLLEEEDLTGILPKARKKKHAFKPFEKKVVVTAKLGGGTSLDALAASLRTLLQKFKVDRDATDSVQYTSTFVTVELARDRSTGYFFLTVIYPPDRESEVRALFDRFVTEESLTTTSLLDFAGNPVWTDRDPANLPAPNLDRLAAMLPVATPSTAFDWAKVTTLLNSSLPPDFAAVTRAHGVGAFGGLRVWSPDVIVREWFRLLPGLHPLRNRLGVVPFIWSGVTVGLLPIAEGPAGLLCWDTEGAPHAWKTVFLSDFASGSPTVHRHDGGFASFLGAAMAGQLSFLRLEPTFVPG